MDGNRIGAICVSLFMILVGAGSLLVAANPQVRKTIAEITQLDTENKTLYKVHYIVVGITGVTVGLTFLIWLVADLIR